MNTLIKLLIKDYNNTSSPLVRARYATLAGGVGIFLNVLLFTMKLTTGLISGSISIIADAFNNLSDAGSSVITMVGFRIAGKEADADHPFGHGRSEYIAGLAVAMIIICLAVELVKGSIDKIIHPQRVDFSMALVVCLVISIMVKLYMYIYNRSLSKRLDSPTFGAVATDSISDVYTTSAVLASIVFGEFTGIAIDGYVGLLVCVMIFRGGIAAFRETTDRLLGAAPDPELAGRIKSIAMNNRDIIGVHDMVIHDYGPGRQVVTFHAEVDSKGDIISLHDTIDNIERYINSKLDTQCVIHMDPVVVGDDELAALKGRVLELAKGLYEGVSIHDFRIVRGPTHSNLVFDVVLPYACPMDIDDYKSQLSDKIKGMEGNYFAAITIDRE